MMIKKIIILVLANFSFQIVFCQENKKDTGFFDKDNIEDIIYYEFFTNQTDGPYYKCKIVCGNGKDYNFDFGVGFECIGFFNCGKGCIQIYQERIGMSGFETNETYIYKKEYDNWILEKSETIYKGGKKEVYKAEVPTGIDGTEYKIETKRGDNNFAGTYKLKSCQNSRFKIEISKEKNAYYYLIFDKEKIISKGKVIMSKNDFSIGKIKGEFSSGSIQIKNYDTANPKLFHFTQCDEKYLTFVKTR